MRKIIRLTESDLIKIVKRVISEQIKVEGPFKSSTTVLGDLYIMKHDKTYCMDQRRELSRNQVSVMTGSTCPQEFLTFPANKFYVYLKEDEKLKLPSPDREGYFEMTNNGQGYDTQEEAKKAIARIFNPENRTGRSVVKKGEGQKGQSKMVSKYDKEGNLTKNKMSWNYTDEKGDVQKGRIIQKTGL